MARIWGKFPSDEPERILSTLLLLDGQYGTGAVLADVAGFAFVARGREDRVLDHGEPAASLRIFARLSRGAPVPCAASACASLVG